MTAENSESQRITKRITVIVESDLAEWIEREAGEKRIGDATFVRMTLAEAMRMEKVGGAA